MSRVGNRKIRSDKKRDVKPTINIDLKDAIYRLAYITQTAVKDVCEQLVRYAINDGDILGELALNFKRDIRLHNTFFNGHRNFNPIAKREGGETERISLRLVENDYEILTALAYALDVRPTRVCALLLDAGMSDYRFVNNYVMRYLHGKISDQNTKELREILRYMNKVSGEHHTMASLLSAIVDEVREPVTRIKEAVGEFVIKHWRDK